MAASRPFPMQVHQSLAKVFCTFKLLYLVIHMKNHSWNKFYMCMSGNFEFTCSTQLRMHLIIHMDGKPYHFTICGNNFSNSKHLVIHMKNHSWNKCDACRPGNFEFTCSTQLGMHLINRMDGKPYHCTVSGNSFSKFKDFVIHMKNHSLNKCDICTSGKF